MIHEQSFLTRPFAVYGRVVSRWAFALVLLTACGSARVKPSRVQESLVTALNAETASQLAAMLPPGVDRTSFDTRFSELRAERKFLAERLRARDVEGVEVETNRGIYRLVPDINNQWTIVSGPSVPSAAESPRDALLALRNALDEDAFGWLMLTLTVETRSLLRARMMAITQALEHLETAPIDIQETSAEVVLSNAIKITLHADDGRWFVHNIEVVTNAP